MNKQPEQGIRYKWNAKTCTGYRLTYDHHCAKQGLHGAYHVEDWNNHLVVDEWGCDTLEEAVRVLSHLFDIDVGKETDLLKQRLEPRVQ